MLADEFKKEFEELEKSESSDLEDSDDDLKLKNLELRDLFTKVLKQSLNSTEKNKDGEKT